MSVVPDCGGYMRDGVEESQLRACAHVLYFGVYFESIFYLRLLNAFSSEGEENMIN